MFFNDEIYKYILYDTNYPYTNVFNEIQNWLSLEYPEDIQLEGLDSYIKIIDNIYKSKLSKRYIFIENYNIESKVFNFAKRAIENGTIRMKNIKRWLVHDMFCK